MIKGLQQAVNELRNLKENSRKAMRRGEKRAADLMKADAQAKAPVNIGRIRDGIFVEQDADSTTLVGGDRIAAYQEFGTGPLVSIPSGLDEDARQFYVNGKGKTSPKPFFFPAVFKHQDKIVPFVEEELNAISRS